MKEGKLKHLKFLPGILLDKKNGLQPLPFDHRDFKTEDLGWGFGYTPKFPEKINETLSVKDQGSTSCCQWFATGTGKEPDEGVILSIRSLVIAGKELGLVGNYGSSNLRSGQKVLQQIGIMEEKDCPDMYFERSTWNQLLNYKLDKELAIKHKIKSFHIASSLDDIYKVLDDGGRLTTGVAWYSGFNMSGGFQSPWIISKNIGWQVGGHAILIKGYKKNYQGKKVFVCQNSYNKSYGDNGNFYVEEAFAKTNMFDKYGCFTNLDVEIDIAKFLNNNNGKNVKQPNSPVIYRIEGGKKRAYPDVNTFFAHNIELIYEATKTFVNEKTFLTVEKELLDQIPLGQMMLLEDGDETVRTVILMDKNKLINNE